MRSSFSFSVVTTKLLRLSLLLTVSFVSQFVASCTRGVIHAEVSLCASNTRSYSKLLFLKKKKKTNKFPIEFWNMLRLSTLCSKE